MKRILALLLALILIAGLVACTSEPEVQEVYEPEVVETPEPVVPEEEDEEEEEEIAAGSDIHGAIHRIEYGDNVVYLFGTIHGGRAWWYPLADVVEDALERADVLVTEVGEIDEMGMVALMFEYAALPDGQTWVEFLPSDAYDHFVEVIAAWEMPYEEVNILHPSFLILLVTMELAQSLEDDFEMGITADSLGVDAYVMNVALERGLPILGLESMEQQLEILYDPPFEVVVAQVMGFLPPEEMIEEMLQYATLGQLADWFETNNLDALNQSFADELDADSEDLAVIYMRETVMNWRSTYYANEIARLLQETEEPTTFFVAVGLSHVIRSGAGEGFTDIVEQLGLLGFTAVPLWR